VEKNYNRVKRNDNRVEKNDNRVEKWQWGKMIIVEKMITG